MSTGITLALLAAIGYGTADFVGGAGARRVPSMSIVFAGQVTGAAAMLTVAFTSPGTPTLAHLAWGLLALVPCGRLEAAQSSAPVIPREHQGVSLASQANAAAPAAMNIKIAPAANHHQPVLRQSEAPATIKKMMVNMAGIGGPCIPPSLV